MIKTTSLYPFQNLLGVTQEFHQDKAVVKVKSLSYEHEYEFEYKDVYEISDSFLANINQINFSVALLTLTFIGLSVFDSQVLAHPIWLRIGQVIYILGLVLLLLGFKKNRHIYLVDKQGNILTTISQNNQTIKLIPEIISLIKNYSKTLNEISINNPFSEKTFKYEYVAYDFSDLEKTTDRFYDDKVIGIQKTVFRERIYQTNYNELNRKLYRGKVTNGVSGWLFNLAFGISMIILGFYFSLGISFGMHLSRGVFYFISIFWVLFFVSLPTNLFKREIIRLNGNNGNTSYWTFISKKNKDTIETILEYVQSKIPPDEKL